MPHTAARGKRPDRRRDAAASHHGLHGHNLGGGQCPAQPGDAEGVRDRPPAPSRRSAPPLLRRPASPVHRHTSACVGENENGSRCWRAALLRASGLACWATGWMAHSLEPVKATSKSSSSLLLRSRNARWPPLTNKFTTSMGARE